MQKLSHNLISETAVDRLIAAHDGNVALLYLWIVRRGSFDAERAAGELCLTLSEVSAAYEKLSRIQSDAVKKEPIPSPEEKLPEYAATDVVRRSKADPEFRAILLEAERRFGRLLSTADTKTLFGIYDYLSLPPDVIFMLLTYCFDLFEDKYGAGRQPSMRSIEKEAYDWANKEILTLEQAEEFIRNAAERRCEEAKVKKALGITGRAATTTETKYIRSWIELGFSADTLALAYDRTVTNTGSLKWNYMNKIVQSWHEKGLFTLEEIESKDGRRPRTGIKNEHKTEASSDELGRLRSLYNKVTNQDT